MNRGEEASPHIFAGMGFDKINFSGRNTRRVKTRRDSQRSKVYTAETVLKYHDKNTEYKNIESVRKRVAKIEKSDWWKKNVHDSGHTFNNVSVIQHKGHASSRACGNNLIKFANAEWARQEWVILHELAHIVVKRLPYKQRKFEPGHGQIFCAIYLKLVRRFMGKDAYNTLRKSFKAHKVKYTKMRSKNKTLFSHRFEKSFPFAVTLTYQFDADEFDEHWIITKTNELSSKVFHLDVHSKEKVAREKYQKLLRSHDNDPETIYLGKVDLKPVHLKRKK